MKRLTIILFVVSIIACRPEKKTRAVTAPPDRASKVVRATASLSSVPPPLLKTPRLTLSFDGSGAFFSPIENCAQAEAMLEDIRMLPPSAARDRATGIVISGLAMVDPNQARVLLDAWIDGLISSWLDSAKAVARALAKSDREAAVKFVSESVPAASQTDIWAEILSSLPPKEFLLLFDRIPESSSKITMAANLLLVWLPEDPGACAAWLDIYTEGMTSKELQILSMPRKYAANSNMNAVPRLAAFRAAETPEARRFLANEVWKHTEASARAALIPELQEGLPDLSNREREEAVASDPAGYAAALSKAQIAALSPADMRKLIGLWAKNHPEAAANWALEHERPEAAAALVPLYYQEPKTALSLALKIPRGSDLDQAVQSMSGQIANDGDVDSAKALLPLITDAEVRERTRREIDHDWK